MKNWQAIPALMLLATPAVAQIEYRNLDQGRPTTLEDAYPIERYAFDLVAGYRMQGMGGGQRHHLFETELAYGIARGWGVGVEAPFALLSGSGSSVAGFAGLRLFAHYNLINEGVATPGIGIRFDARLPVGSLGGTRSAGLFQLLATRSLGPNRVHLNGAVGIQSKDPSAAEALPVWRVTGGIDHTLIRSSTLLVGAVEVLREGTGEPIVLSAGAGIRRQLNPTLVLDTGLTLGFARQRTARVGVSFGLTHTFAIAALMPRGGASR